MNATPPHPMLSPERSGVFLAPASLVALREAAAKARLAWFDLAASGARDKQQFLAACAQSLDFPDWFGRNWDALADCLKDFSWRRAPGYVVLWRGSVALAKAAPEAFATALEIFRDAAIYWKQRGKIFLVLLDREPQGANLERLASK